MNPELHIDIETYSEADLRKVGLYRYAEDPTTEILMVCWAYGDGRVHFWDLSAGPYRPAKLQLFLQDPRCTKWAHNAAFEIELLRQCWGLNLDPEQWRCTMVLAYSLALPGALADVAPVVRAPVDKRKLKDGRRLIAKFSKPRKPSKNNPDTRWTAHNAPEDWRLFLDYCRGDVITEREVHKRLRRWGLSPQEWRLWALDQQINRTGLPVDAALVDSCIKLDGELAGPLLQESTRITGLTNPNSRDQLLPWLARHEYEQTGLTAAEVESALVNDPITKEARRVLEIRQQTSKNSVKKFKALNGALTKDDRLRGGFQFSGAGRTGRWSGRLVQPHNLPRGNVAPEHQDTAIALARAEDPELLAQCYDSPADVLSSLVRPAFAANDPNTTLVVADLASIESVLLAWVTDCDAVLDLFRSGKDTYRDFASRLFGIPYDHVTKAQRTHCKPPVLGCGYGLGKWGLIAYAEGYGGTMSEHESEIAVDTYRASYPEIPEAWGQVNRAFKKVIVNPGKPYKALDGRVAFRKDGPFVFIDLPSGRSLAYLRPKVEQCKTPWGEWLPTVTYEGSNQFTRKWERLSTHGGKIIENIVQAIARDVLADGLRAAHQAGLKIVGHVHDEIICEALISEAPATLAKLIKGMTESSDWCASAPLGAEGWIGRHYRKD